MDYADTARRLEAMTDEGALERLATAVLRRADARLRGVSHPGVNAGGKTVKSPVDGVGFVSGAAPAHMMVVHHTICATKDLERKWLYQPMTADVRGKGGRSTAPAGDIIKTIAIVAQERQRTPELRATLILTTNQEPGSRPDYGDRDLANPLKF